MNNTFNSNHFIRGRISPYLQKIVYVRTVRSLYRPFFETDSLKQKQDV